MNKLTTVFLLALLACGCSKQVSMPAGFPLDKGTTWVYAYNIYRTPDSDPGHTVKAVYQLTETVVDTQNVPPYFVAHVKRDYQLVSADAGWTADMFSNQLKEMWYVVSGQQVFESRQLVDPAAITTDDLDLAYDFPLAANKNWCVAQLGSKDPNHKPGADCQAVGRREVTDQGPYQMPTGKLGDCYDLMDHFNGGNVFQKFCGGVGVVSMKFDHSGTPFGFEQTLVRYSAGAP